MFIPIGDNIQQRSFPIIPCLLIGLNVLVFAHQVHIFVQSEGDAQVEMEFIETWGLVPSHLAQGQVIGLLSHMFVHGGCMHLLGNMVALWAFSSSLEIGLGGLCLLAFYIVWGVIAGLVQTFMDWGSDVPLVGASGAIAGLIGAYTVAYGPDSKIKCLLFISYKPITVHIPAIAFGLGWIGLQLWDASSDPSGMAGIAWYAHIGGFLAGVITMWLMRNQMEQHLTRDNQGQLVFQRRVEQEGGAAVGYNPTGEEAGVPGACPYCGSEMGAECEIAPGLARCPNASCERLVCFQTPVMTS
jgi:membrane associated rhomboid family serine protease